MINHKQNEFNTHWEWLEEMVDCYGEAILETSKVLGISFSDSIALYNFVLRLESADYEEYHRRGYLKNDL